jgi:hypothetical protein
VKREDPSLDAESAIVALLSRWLARHLDNVRLREEIVLAGRDGLSIDQTEAVDELLDELAHAQPKERGDVEAAVRETLEALALG